MNIKCCITLLFLIFLPYAVEGGELAVKGRIGWLIPNSENVSEIYGDALPRYQLEVDYTFCCPWSLWVDGGYLTQNGNTVTLGDPTIIRLYSVSGGVRYNLACMPRLKLYLAAGPSYFFLRIHDESVFVEEHPRQNRLGAVAKFGAVYHLWRCLDVELFVDYQYVRFSFSGVENNVERHNLDMSGPVVGFGIGYSF